MNVTRNTKISVLSTPFWSGDPTIPAEHVTLGNTLYVVFDFLGPDGIQQFALYADDITRQDRTAMIRSSNEADIDEMRDTLAANRTTFWNAVFDLTPNTEGEEG